MDAFNEGLAFNEQPKRDKCTYLTHMVGALFCFRFTQRQIFPNINQAFFSGSEGDYTVYLQTLLTFIRKKDNETRMYFSSCLGIQIKLIFFKD
jgi:hypothetical protein